MFVNVYFDLNKFQTKAIKVMVTFFGLHNRMNSAKAVSIY